MNTNELHFEKLNNENYEFWSIRMKALLVLDECWDVIESEEPQEKDKSKEWIKKNAHALFQIVCFSEDSQLSLIRACETSKKAWEALKSHHEKRILGRTVRLFQRLFKTKLKKKDDMEAHIYQLFVWFDELANLGLPLENEFKTAIIMENVSDFEQMTAEEVKSRIDQQKLTKSEEKSKSNKKDSIQYSNYKCFNCNEVGHISKNCEKKDEW